MRGWQQGLGILWWIALGFWGLILALDILWHLGIHHTAPFVSVSMGLTWAVLLGVSLMWIYQGIRFRLWLLFCSLLVVDWASLWTIPLAGAIILLGVILMQRQHHHGVLIGRRWGIWPIWLATSDRFLHLHVIGPTGSGKSSSILLPLLSQDLKAGRSVALIEPKGDLSLAAYRRAIQAGHTVILFDPESESCPHYNPLSGPPSSAAEGISWALNQIAEAGHPFYAVSSRVLLMYAVMAVKEVQGESANLESVVSFLRRDGERDTILSRVTDDRVLQYFRDQIRQLNPRQAMEQRQGLLNRLELLLINPDIRRVLSPPYDFDWDSVLANQVSVFCPLGLARLGDSARVLGTLLWHGLAMATYRRPLDSPLPPYFLYLDEFHEYVTPDLGEFLALARGYHLGLILAHQDFGQLSPTLREAILANGRQRVVLGGIAPADFDLFKSAANPYPIDPTLRFFPQGRAWVQLTQQGKPRRPHTVTLHYEPLGGPK